MDADRDDGDACLDQPESQQKRSSRMRSVAICAPRRMANWSAMRACGSINSQISMPGTFVRMGLNSP